MAVMVGFRHLAGTSKKTGKDFDAYVVSFVEPERDAQGVGYRVGEQFVDTPMFLAALKVAGLKEADAVNAEIQLVYNRTGYLEDFSILAPAEG